MPVTSPVVLLVDDHPDSIEMYTFALLTLGLEPIGVDDAEQGFAHACARRPDVVVIDMTVSSAPGLELARQLREDRRTNDVAIIVLTSDASELAQAQARDAGCDRFLLKPCAPDTLAREIRNLA